MVPRGAGMSHMLANQPWFYKGLAGLVGTVYVIYDLLNAQSVQECPFRN